MLFTFMKTISRSSKNRNSSKCLLLQSRNGGLGRIIFYFSHSALLMHVFLPLSEKPSWRHGSLCESKKILSVS